MAIVPTERIRNVVVLGHTATGKSTLVEAMLRVAGEVSGPLDGCPTLDTEPEEQERGHTLSLSLASLTFDGHRVNLLDTPGGAEAIGDVWPGTAAADVAVLVVDATVGLQPQHLELWDLCEQVGLPRVVFINRLDLDRARYPARVAELRATWGPRIATVELPWEEHEQLEGVIDVVHEVAIEEHDGLHRQTELPPDRRDEVDRAHEVLVEAVVEHDDDLLTRYLDGDLPTDVEVEGQLAADVASQTLVPVLCGAAAHDVGVEPLLRFLVDECPAPTPLDADGPVACVVKTITDPYVGRICVLRLLGGELACDDHLVVRRTGAVSYTHLTLPTICSV